MLFVNLFNYCNINLTHSNQCYDLRFPEMSLILRSMGADILTYPSAFTVLTGQAHWEILLRNKAIENQCYIIAAAQCGHHNSKRASYGHSMVNTIILMCVIFKFDLVCKQNKYWNASVI